MNGVGRPAVRCSAVQCAVLGFSSRDHLTWEDMGKQNPTFTPHTPALESALSHSTGLAQDEPGRGMTCLHYLYCSVLVVTRQRPPISHHLIRVFGTVSSPSLVTTMPARREKLVEQGASRLARTDRDRNSKELTLGEISSPAP